MPSVNVIPDPNQQAQQELMQALSAMASQASQAQAGASQAGQQYQEAASAPQPQLNPFAALTGGLLPDIASILSGNKEYSQRGQSQVKTAKAELMQRRVDNLTALADAYEQKSKAARDLGNKAMELEFKEKQDRVLRQHETVLENLKQDALGERETRQQTGETERQNLQDANELAKQRLQNQGDLAEQRLRNEGSLANTQTRVGGVVGGSSSDAGISDAELASLENGTSTLKDYKQERRGAVIRALAARGSKLVPPKVRETVAAIQSARAALDEIKELSAKVNTAPGGWARYAKGFKNAAGGISELDPDAALLKKKSDSLLAMLARARGEKGNLSNKDIERAGKALPGWFTSDEVARRSLGDADNLFNEIEQRTIAAYTTKLGGGATIKMRAPDGRLLEVPNNPDEIKRMIALKAVRI